MLVHSNGARLCAAFFVAFFFSSAAIAQASAVSDRASLAGDDIIDWANYYDGAGFTYIASPSAILTNGGTLLNVGQSQGIWSVILPMPNDYGWGNNMPEGMHLYDTYNASNLLNVISFADFDGMDVCALGTQVTPYETGGFTARIEGFDADGTLGFFDFTSSTDNPDAQFVGIESVTPMTRVEISLHDTAGGALSAYYSINQVDLRACVEEPPEPEAPVFSCAGFEAPLDKFPVKVKKKRVLPLKMVLLDADGIELTDADLVTAPVVEVAFSNADGGDPIDVTDEVATVGKADEGNQFIYSDGTWQFKLSTRNYTANGTYEITAVSGDEAEYTIDPSCLTSFAKK